MKTKKDVLSRYRKKRDFSASPEPRGKITKSSSKRPIFVIQKHASKRLHYDVRIEIDGVLKSWAVPKGPSTNPAEKRLAIATEDHPIEYAEFEGVIPEDHYGAGVVLVWDSGEYENIKEKDGTIVPMQQCLKDGQIELFLHGQKVYGRYALVKTRNGQWLLVKMRDEYADARKNPVSTQQKSVLTGRTLKQIERDALKIVE